jgi:S-adenosylmethionine synthetase
MLFTSESVTSGHPDKICDRISDTVLDELLKIDPKSKVAVDTWIKDNKIGLIGEIKTEAKLNYLKIIKNVIKEIGYNEIDFNPDNLEIFNFLGKQSNEINQAVVQDKKIGAGDQGMMFGMACKQTNSLIPLPIYLAHNLAKGLEDFRKHEEKTKGKSILKPDGKTQITVEFENKGNYLLTDLKPKRIDTILISSQHIAEISQEELKGVIQNQIIDKILEENSLDNLVDENTNILINPSGSFVQGGPIADSGMTGRKIVVDSYGGWGRNGGGAFSGKDFSKVDRSGAYMARYLARWIVKNEWANTAEIQLSYAIGVPEPVSIEIYGDLTKSKKDLISEIRKGFDLTPSGIVEFLKLDKPIYQKTATYGHFGRKAENGFFEWEK